MVQRLGCRGEGVQRFRGGLVFKAQRLVYHATLNLRVIKRTKKEGEGGALSLCSMAWSRGGSNASLG